ncbi:putative copper-transporting ATPase [Nymphaea thermarum]|nr:putative copper-transporting ATPase [Nymphaea thermarum]
MYIPRVKGTLEHNVVNMLTFGGLLSWILSTPVQFTISRTLYSGSYTALRYGTPNPKHGCSLTRAKTSPNFMGMDFFSETSSKLILFILLGKYLEVLSKGNVISAEEIDARLIKQNNVIKILPGKKVAAHGIVVWGQSLDNENMIRGILGLLGRLRMMLW